MCAITPNVLEVYVFCDLRKPNFHEVHKKADKVNR